MTLVNDYVDGLTRCLGEILQQNVAEIAEIIFEAYTRGKQVFIMGNGGSASTASHFTCDLSFQPVGNKPRIKVMGLTDNMAIITARANDIDYSSVFVEQLKCHLNKGDVVIGISASGNSPNVLKAIEYAKKQGATTIGFAGFNGGKLNRLAERK